MRYIARVERVNKLHLIASSQPLLLFTHSARFAGYAMAAAQKGAELLIYPGAFNHITGPAHWQLLQQARALDNQLYVATASPSLDPNFSYKAHGCALHRFRTRASSHFLNSYYCRHSSVVGPWGNVLAQCAQEDAIVVADINLNWVAEVGSNYSSFQLFGCFFISKN